MYMDDIKQFPKGEKELEILIQTRRIYSQKKCSMLIMRSGKRHIMEGIKLPNQERIKTLKEKETNKYLRIVKADTIN